MQFTARLLKSVAERETDDVFLIGTQHLNLNDAQARDEIERIAHALIPAVARDIASGGNAVAEIIDDELGGDGAQQVMTLLLAASLSRAVGGRIGLSESEISEYLGLQASGAEPAVIDRLLLEWPRWTAIRGEVQRAFNARLATHGLKTSAWKVGDNPVDRLLGYTAWRP